MKIGFIGLGIMGKPMSRNLLNAGFDLIVYDIDRAAVEIIEKAGAKGAASSEEVARNADVIITMLPRADIGKSVLEEILTGIRENSIVIDMSSVSPVVSKEFARMVEAKNCKFLDAPVSGGEIGAIKATLAFMIGGDEAVVEKVRPVFKALGKSIMVVGGNGSGSVAKLANQIMVNLNIAAVAEALVLATKGREPTRKKFLKRCGAVLPAVQYWKKKLL